MSKLILYKAFGRYCITTEENYNSRIMDGTKVMRFSDGFTKEQAVSYVTNYGLATKEELIDRTGE